MFQKLQNHVDPLTNCFEKIVISRNYADFLFENDKNSILANSKFTLKIIIHSAILCFSLRF